ncbi:MAG: hypothetical protein ISS78_03480 [Phycisphaerae bacterium]|nr:hypothetical protein [Phycisphaerae bacterium]
MTDISVANKDWAIIGAVVTALETAEINGEAVFQDVTVTTSSGQAAECQLIGPTPKAIVRYVATVENVSPEDVRGCRVVLELLICTKITGGVDESSRAEEILRLTNAARNAVEASPPADASAWAGTGYHHDAVRWGQAEINATESLPWAICRVPVEIGFVLEAGIAH